MSYTTTSIGGLLNSINVTHFLPAIQRPFVWKQEQTLTLFDSILRGYPIGTFMFWQIDEETKEQVRIYRFIENYSGEESMNEPARTEGRDVVLVLDGQQRITSLLIGLRGTFSTKKKHTHRSNPDNWERQQLYLDLLKDPDDIDEDDEDAERNIAYGLKFDTHAPRSSHRHLWLRLSTILNYSSEEQLASLERKMLGEMHRDATPRETDIVLRNLRRLHAVIWGEQLLNFYTETNQSPDRVLEIFVRSNSSGSPLKKPDFMMSLITSRWEHGAAREEVMTFADYLSNNLPLRNKVGIEFMMKACLTLCDYDVKFNVSNFTADAIRTIERSWPAIKSALERTFLLLNSLGIDETTLTSRNAVLPIAYFLYASPETTLRGTSAFEAHNALAIHHWLVQSLLVGAFAGASDNTIAKARATIRKSLEVNRNFPIDALFDALAGHGRISRLDARGIDDVLKFEYGKPKTILALKLIQIATQMSGTILHVDHIIPEASADQRVLRGAMVPDHRIKAIKDVVNRLGNLQFLSAEDNLEKNDLPFASWITSRHDAFLDQHLIPRSPDLWMVTRLPEFVAERDKLIRKALMKVCGLERAEWREPA